MLADSACGADIALGAFAAARSRPLSSTTPSSSTGATAQANPATAPASPDAVAPATSRSQLMAAGVATVGLVAFDHATKLATIHWLKPTTPFDVPVVTIIPGVFQFRYAENRGAAFSLFDGNVGALAIVSLVASVLIAWWWTRLPASEHWGRWALVMILGGAIGNLIDRAFRGFVVDMLDFYVNVGGHQWPVFNVADSLICVGVGIVMVRAWKGRM